MRVLRGLMGFQQVPGNPGSLQGRSRESQRREGSRSVSEDLQWFSSESQGWFKGVSVTIQRAQGSFRVS